MTIAETALALVRDAIRKRPGAADELRAMLPELEALATPEAAYVLGGAYMNVFADDARAFAWFERAGEHGGALRSLGFLVEHGRGAARDRTRAADYYERAAKLGDVFAQHNIGICYRDGHGRDVDLAAAQRWLRAAAEQGSVTGMAALAGLLDAAEARTWYVRAAEAGHGGAMRAAADSYRDGHPPDLVQAARWYFRLLSVGNGDGIHEISHLMPRMTDADVLRAAELAGDRSLGETAISAWRR